MGCVNYVNFFCILNVFFCVCRLMRPLSKVETLCDGSLHSIVENIINIIPYQLRGVFFKNLSQ